MKDREPEAIALIHNIRLKQYKETKGLFHHQENSIYSGQGQEVAG